MLLIFLLRESDKYYMAASKLSGDGSALAVTAALTIYMCKNK